MKFNFHLVITLWYLLLANTTFAYTRQDTLRGSNGEGRRWWDVKHYSLTVYIDGTTKSIGGENIIKFNVVEKPIDVMQIDLQDTLTIDSVFVYDFDTIKRAGVKDELVVKSVKANFVKDGKIWWVHYDFSKWPIGANKEVKIYYHGKPRVARTPPWDGGVIWGVDSMGSPWYSVACQGLGASSWWPCKDYQADEPDEGMLISVSPRAGKMTVISNGVPQLDVFKSRINVWEVKNPINTYNATFYGGAYVGWTDTLMGEKGKLDLSFYVLRQNEAKAKSSLKLPNKCCTVLNTGWGRILFMKTVTSLLKHHSSVWNTRVQLHMAINTKWAIWGRIEAVQVLALCSISSLYMKVATNGLAII